MLLSLALVGHALAAQPLPFVGVTADYFVLQFHFETRTNSLASFAAQMEQLPRIFNASNRTLLPATIVWRVVAPQYRGNTSVVAPGQYPSLLDNVATIRRLAKLYDAAIPKQTLELVYYPDIEKAYAQYWGVNKAEKRDIKRDPTLAVSRYMPQDLERWNEALVAAAYADRGTVVTFNELVFETYGAPMAPATRSDQQPTLTLLRANALLAAVRTSLTPDFSVLEGKCREDVADDCYAFVRPPGLRPSLYGRYYTQVYNVYTKTERFKRGDAALTDVTPWDPAASLGADCPTQKSHSACARSGKCCAWSNVPGIDLCYPVQSSECLVPKPGLCDGDRYDGCDPPPGGTLYDRHTSPTNASIRIGQIVADRLLDRCSNPGATTIELLDSTTLWNTFPMVFSYEKWSAMGPPLYLLGNPNFHIGALEWGEFVHGFKRSLSAALQYNGSTHSNISSPLCAQAAATIATDLKIGIYWARRALQAWGAEPTNASWDGSGRLHAGAAASTRVGACIGARAGTGADSAVPRGLSTASKARA